MSYNKLSNCTMIRHCQVIYPFINIQTVFNENELNEIELYTDTFTLHNSLVGEGKSNNDIRRSKISFFNSDNNSKWIFDKVNNIVEEVNDIYYNFELIGYDSFQYTQYDSSNQGCYEEHIDTITGDPFSHNDPGYFFRKLSFIAFLSDTKDYSGGELIMNLGKGNKHTIQQKRGSGIIFPSFLLHGITPVTSGIRKSLVTWITGPKFK